MTSGYQVSKNIIINMENKVVKLLEDLNLMALNYDSYEYGLATDNSVELDKMCKLVNDFLANQSANYLPEDEMTNLFLKAKSASEKTYSPFSNFPVGAAVLTNSGEIYTGSNVENSSYGLTICAERTVLSHMVGTGVRDIKAIAVFGTVESLSPCGACRQFIYEFGKDIIVVFLDNGSVIQKTITELLPYGFAF